MLYLHTGGKVPLLAVANDKGKITILSNLARSIENKRRATITVWCEMLKSFCKIITYTTININEYWYQFLCLFKMLVYSFKSFHSRYWVVLGILKPWCRYVFIWYHVFLLLWLEFKGITRLVILYHKQYSSALWITYLACFKSSLFAPF